MDSEFEIEQLNPNDVHGPLLTTIPLREFNCMYVETCMHKVISMQALSMHGEVGKHLQRSDQIE